MGRRVLDAPAEPGLEIQVQGEEGSNSLFFPFVVKSGPAAALCGAKPFICRDLQLKERP